MIVQRFIGLNVWDQLAVEIEVNGNLPDVPSNAALVFPDTNENYQFLQENKIQSASSGQITVNDQTISYSINQLVILVSSFLSKLMNFHYVNQNSYLFFLFPNKKIDFETFREQTGEPLNTFDTQPLFIKVSKITANYQEKDLALRLGMITKVVRNSEINPCTDGTATCNPNSVCVPDAPNDSYLVSEFKRLSVFNHINCFSNNLNQFSELKTFSVNVKMDFIMMKHSSPVLTSTNVQRMAIFVTKTQTVSMNWAVMVVAVTMDFMEMVTLVMHKWYQKQLKSPHQLQLPIQHQTFRA